MSFAFHKVPLCLLLFLPGLTLSANNGNHAPFSAAPDPIMEPHGSIGPGVNPMNHSRFPAGEGEGIDTLRFRSVLLGKGIFTAGTYFALHRAWYQDHPRSAFHFFDDSRDWLQVDKLGHFWSAFHLSRSSSALWKWSGMKGEKAALWGAGAGALFLTGVEVMDGFSAEWGASLSDAGSNLLGSALFYFQERKWGKAYFQPVFSYRLSRYSKYRPELLGSSFPERLLKDYNGQSYWIDIHPELFGKEHPIPSWIALSVGYGAEGMLGGSRNPAVNGAGVSLPRFERTRRFYLSFDLILSELPVEGKGWRTLFKVLDAFRFPFPALEYSPQGGVRGHWLGP